MVGGGAVGGDQAAPRPPHQLRVPRRVGEEPGGVRHEAGPGLQQDHEAGVVVAGGRLHADEHLAQGLLAPGAEGALVVLPLAAAFPWRLYPEQHIIILGLSP